MSEKRIYVVVAETVQADKIEGAEWSFPIVVQPAGRLAAQCAHVVGKMRVARHASFKEKCEPITTIVLSARNSKELINIKLMLVTFGFQCETFFDENPAYGYSGYGRSVGFYPAGVMTAICTHPQMPEDVDHLLGHLPLWSPCGGGR